MPAPDLGFTRYLPYPFNIPALVKRNQFNTEQQKLRDESRQRLIDEYIAARDGQQPLTPAPQAPYAPSSGVDRTAQPPMQPQQGGGGLSKNPILRMLQSGDHQTLSDLMASPDFDKRIRAMTGTDSTLTPGDQRVDGFGNVVAAVPPNKQFVSQPEGSALYTFDPQSGGMRQAAAPRAKTFAPSAGVAGGKPLTASQELDVRRKSYDQAQRDMAAEGQLVDLGSNGFFEQGANGVPARISPKTAQEIKRRADAYIAKAVGGPTIESPGSAPTSGSSAPTSSGRDGYSAAGSVASEQDAQQALDANGGDPTAARAELIARGLRLE